MELSKLDHVNIRTSRLALMVDWYRDILGLQSGKRPNFPFDGAWMYLGDQPVVHLIAVDADKIQDSHNDLKLEHFAFSAHGLKTFEEKLARLDIPFRRAEIPEMNLVQININDPDGNHIHVDFKRCE